MFDLGLMMQFGVADGPGIRGAEDILLDGRLGRQRDADAEREVKLALARTLANCPNPCSI